MPIYRVRKTLTGTSETLDIVISDCTLVNASVVNADGSMLATILLYTYPYVTDDPTPRLIPRTPAWGALQSIGWNGRVKVGKTKMVVRASVSQATIGDRVYFKIFVEND